jgi:catechol 2,3-dioxygenase-like lactoylglutathione lyase family enzyme
MMSTQTSATAIAPVVGNQIILVQHEGIATVDADRSRDFYMKVLGLEVLPRPPLGTHGYWLGRPGIYPQIHIIQGDRTPPGPEAPISPRGRHTCFEVADYDALKALFGREGIRYVENQQPGGRWQMLCNDPDGNTLEFQRSTS